MCETNYNEKMNFSKLKNMYIFRIKLKNITPIHVGGNSEDSVTSKNPIMRVSENGNPFIPGSTLKGLMRSASERLAHLFFDREPCYLDGDKACAPHKNVKIEEKIKEIEQKEDRKISEEKIYNLYYDELCPICRTYGGGSIASKVKFEHIVFPANTLTNIREGIQIDRDTGTVKGNRFYNYEYILPNYEFEMVITAENMTEENLKVLALALAQLQGNQIRIGGMLARGLGQIEFISGTVKIYDFSKKENKNAIIQTLLGKDTPTENKTLTEFLEKVL